MCCDPPPDGEERSYYREIPGATVELQAELSLLGFGEAITSG